jgi:cytoskeletal protein CcmA (bactofilin family)
MSDFRPDEKNVVYIGEGVSMTGSIQAQDTVVVDGNVDGEIACGQLIVGTTGVVTGAISVSEADVYGKIGTDITVKQLLIVRASGRVEGKWTYGEIEVEKGAVLSGNAESTEFRSERKIGKDDPSSRHSFKKPELVHVATEKVEPEKETPRVASLATRSFRERKKGA